MASTKDLPRRLRAAVERETRGEAIRWISRPGASRTFLYATSAWLFGIVWSAITFPIFAALLASFLSGKPAGRVVPAWEVVVMVAALVVTGAFALIGAATLLSPFAAWWKARRTVHVITDRRLITIVAGWSAAIKSFRPGELHGMSRREHADGRGTLTVTTGWTRDSDGDLLTQSEQLIGVGDAGSAERLIRALQERERP